MVSDLEVALAPAERVRVAMSVDRVRLFVTTARVDRVVVALAVDRLRQCITKDRVGEARAEDARNLDEGIDIAEAIVARLIDGEIDRDAVDEVRAGVLGDIRRGTGAAIERVVTR